MNFVSRANDRPNVVALFQQFSRDPRPCVARCSNDCDFHSNLQVRFAIPHIHNTRCFNRQKIFAEGGVAVRITRESVSQHETEKEPIKPPPGAPCAVNRPRS